MYIVLLAGTLAVLAILLSGVGLLIRRWLAPGPLTGRDLLLCPWLGWAGALALLQFWHCWLPADGRALAWVALPGVAGLVLAGRSLRAWYRTPGRRLGWFLLLVLLAALWIAGQAVRQPDHPDSALYHVPSVKWAASYPVVPGIGNLRNILAYNSSYFLYAGMLGAGPFLERYHHLASSLLFFLLLIRCLAAWWRLAVRRAPPDCSGVFDAVLLVPVIRAAMGVYAASPSPDVGAWVLTLVVASELLRLLEGIGVESRPASAGRAAALGLLAAAGLTVKLSFAVFGAVALGAALLCVRGNAPVGRLAAIGALVVVTWMVRGVIQSGYPAYPSTAAGFPVEWRMDPESARRNVDWLVAWGRTPGATPEEALGNWRWVWLWFNRVIREGIEIPVCAALLVLGACLTRWCRTAGETVARNRLLPLCFLPPLAGLAYWFLTSPQLRFATGTFWALGAAGLALGLRGLAREKALAVLLAASVAMFANSVDPFEVVRPWRQNAGTVRTGRVVPLKTRWGLTVYVPAPGTDGCWNAPLPNTSGPEFLNPNLRLRVPGDLSKGFVLDPK